MDDKRTRFEDLRLLPGHPLQLDFDGYTSDRDKSLLVGYRSGQGLVVSTPIVNGSAMALKPGTELTVRLFAPQMNCACAFRTSITHVSRSPYPHIHLSMPGTLVLGAVRSSTRARVELPANVNYGDKLQQQSQAQVQDLSLGGARLVAKMLPVVANDKIGLTAELKIGDVTRTIMISGIVRSLAQAPNGVAIGVQFNELDDVDKITLHAYVLANILGQ